jgi:hypothetical protein
VRVVISLEELADALEAGSAMAEMTRAGLTGIDAQVAAITAAALRVAALAARAGQQPLDVITRIESSIPAVVAADHQVDQVLHEKFR